MWRWLANGQSSSLSAPNHKIGAQWLWQSWPPSTIGGYWVFFLAFNHIQIRSPPSQPLNVPVQICMKPNHSITLLASSSMSAHCIAQTCNCVQALQLCTSLSRIHLIYARLHRYRGHTTTWNENLSQHVSLVNSLSQGHEMAESNDRLLFDTSKVFCNRIARVGGWGVGNPEAFWCHVAQADSTHIVESCGMYIKQKTM